MKVTLALFCGLSLGGSARADEIRLHIVGPDGKPVESAQIRVVEWRGLPGQRIAETPYDLTSDAEGRLVFQTQNTLTTPATADPTKLSHGIGVRIGASGLAFAMPVVKAGDNKINLKAGQTWGGVAQDANQQPVAGAKVVVRGFDGPDAADRIYFPVEFQLESVTDTKGQWSFEGLPLYGKVQLQIVDPRFVRETLWPPLDTAGPLLFVERGATIKGRLLTPEGLGAANIPLYPSGTNSAYYINDARTDPNGRFEFPSLRAGDYTLVTANATDFVSGQPLPYVIEPLRVDALTSGEARDVGDWNAKAGIVVKGKVVESKTKLPLAATLSLWGGSSATGHSGKNGDFSFLAGEAVTMASVRANGHVGTSQPLPPLRSGVIDMGTVELRRGFEVRGVVKDKSGHGVSRLYLSISDWGDDQGSAFTNSNGEFTFTALAPGTYRLKVRDAKLADEVKFTVWPDQKTAPVEAILDNDYGADKPKLIRGTARDTAGNPVAGARVLVRVAQVPTSELSRSFQEFKLISGPDGGFEAKTMLSNGTPQFGTTSRPGFVLANTPEFKIVDGVWRGDVILQARGAVLRGQTIDSAGHPIPHAFVTVAGRSDMPLVASDENGAFSLPDVPNAGVILVASNGRGYGESTLVKAGIDSQIIVRQGANYDAVTLAKELLPNAQLGDLRPDQWTKLWDALGTPQMEAAVLHADNSAAAKHIDWDSQWEVYLDLLSKRDPKAFLARGDELLVLAPKDRDNAPLLLATMRAQSDNPNDQQKARDWLKAQEKKPLTLTENTVTALLQRATVAEALEKGSAKKWLDFAGQIAAQLPDEDRADGAYEWGDIATSMNATTFENLIADWPVEARLNALQGAMSAYAKAGDIAATSANFQRLETTATATLADSNGGQTKEELQNLNDRLDSARQGFANALAKTEPARALEMVGSVGELYRSSLLLEIAKDAAKSGQNEVATKALRQVFASTKTDFNDGVSAAKVALDFDPQLAEELFPLALAKFKTPQDDFEDFGPKPSLAYYAAARDKQWPGESRLLIEAEWAERIKAYKPPDSDNYDFKLATLRVLVKAMAKIDAYRALEMAEILPEKDDARAKARGLVVLALLGA